MLKENARGAWRISLCCLSVAIVTLSQAAEGEAKPSELRQQIQEFAEQQLAEHQLQVDIQLPGAAHYYRTVAQINQGDISREDLRVRLSGDGRQWRSAHLSSPVAGLNNRLLVEHIDAQALQVDADGNVSGMIEAWIGRQSTTREMGQAENMHSMLKARRRSVLDWHIGGRQRVEPSRHTLHLGATTGVQVLQVTLTIGQLLGEQRAANPPDPDDTSMVSWGELSSRLPRAGKDLHIALRQVGEHWHSEYVHSPRWNKGMHSIAVDTLALNQGRLQGRLIVTLNPDPWLSPQPDQRTITLDIDAPVEGGEITDRYAAQGGFGVRQGPLSGTVRLARRVPYRFTGVDGTVSGEALVSVHRGALPQLSEAVNTQPQAYYSCLNNLASAVLALPHRPAPHAGTAALQARGETSVLAAYTQALNAYAQATISALSSGHRPLLGNQTSSDPNFGPFMQLQPLANGQLPDDTGAEGPQRWQRVTDWQSLGPVAGQGHHEWAHQALPEVVPGPEGLQLLNQQLILGKLTDIPLQWRPAQERGGLFRPSQQDYAQLWIHSGKLSSYSRHPVVTAYRSREARGRHLVWFAHSVIDAPRAVTTWLSLRVNRGGQAWLNGVPIWHSGSDFNPAIPVLIPVTLQAGENNLLVRCLNSGVGYAPPDEAWRVGVDAAIATAGSPRSKADLASAQATIDHPPGAASPAPQKHSHPAADPPLAWRLDTQDPVNVAWRIPRPAASSAPVAAAGRLFVAAEPATVSAYDTQSGKHLWTQSLAQKGSEGDQTQGSDQRQRALQRMAQISDRLEAIKASKDDDYDADTELPEHAAGEDELRSLQASLTQLRQRWGDPQTTTTTSGPYLGAAPVVNESALWVHFSNGVLACFDHQGNQRWRTETTAWGDLGESGAPLLVDDTVVVQVAQPAKHDDDGQVVRAATYRLLAFAAADGTPRWQSPAINGIAQGISAVMVQDEQASTQQTFLLSPDGTVLSARQGRVLFTDIVPFAVESPPLVSAEQAIYITREGMVSVRFWLDADRPAYRWQYLTSRNANIGAPGIIHDGFLYVPRMADEHHLHHTVPWIQMDVYDAQSGQQLARPNPVLRDARRPHALVLAGDYLIASSDGGGDGVRRPTPKISVLSLGQRPKMLVPMELGVNDSLRAAPTVTGDTMVLATGRELIALRRKAGDDARYEEEAIAETVLRTIGRQPEVEQPIAIAPWPEVPAMLPLNQLISQALPSKWLATEPMPHSSDVDLVDHFGGPQALIAQLDGAIEFAGATYPLTQMSPESGLVYKGPVGVPAFGGIVYYPNYLFDLRRLFGNASQRQIVMAAALQISKPRTLRYQTEGQGVRAWINDQPIQQGSTLHLSEGRYVLLLHGSVARLPPVSKPIFSAHFIDIESSEQALQSWLDDIDHHREQLQRIIEHLPQTSMAIRAKNMLEHLAASREP